MPYSGMQSLEFQDLQVLNRALAEGEYTFEELFRVISERAGVPPGTAYGRTLRTVIEKTERRPEPRTNAELDAEVYACKNANAFTLRVARCLITGWVGFDA